MFAKVKYFAFFAAKNSTADFVRDPEALSTYAIRYFTLRKSINQSVRIRLIRQICDRTDPLITIGERGAQLLTPHS